MATWAYPALPPNELKKEEEASLARELEWLLNSLQESLTSLKSGLEECVALLATKEPGSTLVLSSLRSESVKGFVTRIGTKIVKGDIHLRLPTLPPPPSSKTQTYHLSLSSNPHAPSLPLPQLTSVLTHINNSLDVIDVSTYTGNPHDASFIAGQLRLLQENLSEARLALKGDRDEVDMEGRKWFDGGSADAEAFDPKLPANLSFHLSIHDASLILQLRTLEPVSPNPHTTSPHPDTFSSLTGGLSSLFYRGPKLPVHDEVDKTFVFRGQEVRVKEKVRVESASDPSLMSVMAKVAALEHGVKQLGRALATVMGVERDDGDES